MQAFRDNRRALIGLAAPVAAILVLQAFMASPLQNVPQECLDPTILMQDQACMSSVQSVLFAALATQLMFLVVAGFAAIGSCRAALRTTLGGRGGLTDLLDPGHAVAFGLYVVVFGLFAMVGTVMCLLPGLLVVFLLQLGPFYVLDRGYRPGQAMAASARAAFRHPGPALLMAVVNVLALLLGESCLGILMLLVVPLTSLFTAHMYRQFNHEQVP